jgi:hypothetical protein
LIESLQKPQIFDHPTEGFELVETHISYVLLAGPLAYKFKKPVNFGFLDFSTLEKGRFYCEEETPGEVGRFGSGLQRVALPLIRTIDCPLPQETPDGPANRGAREKRDVPDASGPEGITTDPA